MTPERVRLLEAVAKVAEGALAEWDKDAIMHVSPLRDALSALRAHDAAAPVVGETVEVRAEVWRMQSGRIAVCEAGYRISGSSNDRFLATITARVPLPSVPVIPATVEEVKR